MKRLKSLGNKKINLMWWVFIDATGSGRRTSDIWFYPRGIEETKISLHPLRFGIDLHKSDDPSSMTLCNVYSICTYELPS